MADALEVALELPELQGVERGERVKVLAAVVRRTQLLRLAMQGLNAAEAARIVGCHPNHARATYAEPEFRKEVLAKVDQAFAGVDSQFVERKLTLHQKIEEQAERSFDGLVELLEDPDLTPHLKTRIHQDFLNRSAESQQHSQVNYAKVDPLQLARAAATAREMNNVLPFAAGKKAS